jgi:hypothetical protein
LKKGNIQFLQSLSRVHEVTVPEEEFTGGEKANGWSKDGKGVENANVEGGKCGPNLGKKHL